MATTKPVPNGTKTIGLSVSKKMAAELERRADSMQLSTGTYCRIVLREWIESGNTLVLGEK